MIMAESLDPRDEEVERNLKSIEESKIEEVKLFENLNPQTMRMRKNLLDESK